MKGKLGKEYNKINSLNIFYNSIGIGFTNYKNEGCKGNADSGEYTYCENTLTEKTLSDWWSKCDFYFI